MSKYFADSYLAVESFQKIVPSLATKTDDVIDALALAVIGALGLRFGFITLPKEPMKDTTGLFMQIVGAKIS